MQIEYRFSYNGVNYSKSIIANEQNVFSDFHPVVNISTDSGTLYPLFNYSCTGYSVLGTDKDVEVTVEVQENNQIVCKKYQNDSQNPVLPVKINSAGREYDYRITYEAPVVIDFEGRQFYQTFYDDFEGTELNPKNFHHSAEEERQPYQKNHGFWRNECAYLDGNGNLVIEAKKTLDGLISGAVETSGLFEQSHGFYEMRFKCDKTSGLWYAFWLMGQNDEAHIGNGATDAAEIDIWELVPNEKYGNGPNYFKTTINWDASLQDNDHFGGMCNGTNWIIISSEFGAWGGDVDENLLPARMMVDWVRVGVER